MGKSTKAIKAASKVENSLTANQYEVLKLLYKFRFCTIELIAQAQGCSYNAAYVRLSSMVKQRYLLRKHEGHAKVQGLPAIYSLAKKGRDVLRREPNKYAENVITAIRRNIHPSENFIEYNLMNFAVFNSLKNNVAENCIYLSKSNLAHEKYNFLPQRPPDGVLKNQHEDNTHHHFIYLVTKSKPDFDHMRRLAFLLKYEASGAWESKTGTQFPKILLVCESKRLQTTIHKKFKSLVSKYDSDILFASSLISQIITNPADAIWNTRGNETVLFDNI